VGTFILEIAFTFVLEVLRLKLIPIAAVGFMVARALAGDGPISEGKFVPIGGIDQWIGIHGADEANPVVLVVHGGPGEAQTPLEHLYAGWLNDFTVVQWDQRGAGKTFGHNGKATPDLTLERLIQDGVEVADYTRQRLHKKRIILLGHSWGSFLGVNIIRKRPDLFFAFVGTGQVVSWAQIMASQHAWTIRRAEAEKNHEALKELQEIGPPPYEWGPKFLLARKWLNRYLADADVKYLQSQSQMVRSAPDFSSQDFQDWIAGLQFSMDLLYPTVATMDLPKTAGNSMPVPFFVIQGEEDHITPTNAAAGYFRAIHAPKKGMLVIKGAGHFAYATHQKEFLTDLVQYVTPLAMSR